MKAIVLFASLLASALFPTVVAGQHVPRANATAHSTVAVQTIRHQPAESNKLRSLFADILREEIDIAGIDEADDAETRLVVSAIPIGSDAAIWVSIFQVLPQPIVDFAAEHEAFYLAFPADDMPPEGKEIRQYMSRDYLRQFMMLVDQYENVVPVSELRDAARQVVEMLNVQDVSDD